MFYLLLTSVDDGDVEFWSQQIERYRRLLRLQSISFDMTKFAVTRMDLLAAGVGVGVDALGNESMPDRSESGKTEQTGSLEAWVKRQSMCVQNVGGLLLMNIVFKT